MYFIVSQVNFDTQFIDKHWEEVPYRETKHKNNKDP